jgi:hypothetical protein
MLRSLVLAAVVIATPLAAAAQDAERLRLTNKIIEVQGDMSEQIARGFNLPLPSSMPADQQKRLHGLLNDELTAHKADFAALAAQVAALWARTFTAEELQQLVDYYGSASGKMIVEKELSSGMGVSAPTNLTPEEAAVYKSFKESAAGRAIEAHRMDLAVGTLTVVQPLMMSMINEVQAKRCVIDATCPKAP